MRVKLDRIIDDYREERLVDDFFVFVKFVGKIIEMYSLTTKMKEDKNN